MVTTRVVRLPHWREAGAGKGVGGSASVRAGELEASSAGEDESSPDEESCVLDEGDGRDRDVSI